MGQQLKPSWYDRASNDYSLLISKDLKAFKIKDPRRVDFHYLINELRGSEVQRQLDGYRSGAVIQRISVDDFLRVKIPLPSLEQQRGHAAALNEVFEQINQFERDKAQLVRGGRIERDNRFASLKHTLGRPRQSILSAARVMRGYLRQLGDEGVAIDKAYANFYNQDKTMSDTLQGIIDDVTFISRQLERGEHGLRVEDYELEPTLFKDIYRVVKNLPSAGYKFDLVVSKDSLEKDQIDWSKLGIWVNTDLLKIMIDNLIANAKNHGFEEKKPGNEMRINFGAINDNLVVEIKNNGKPFPSGFGQEQYIEEFSRARKSTGDGIGGYQIHQIARYFGDENWTLVSDATELFPVSFTFQFPLLTFSFPD